MCQRVVKYNLLKYFNNCFKNVCLINTIIIDECYRKLLYYDIIMN